MLAANIILEGNGAYKNIDISKLVESKGIHTIAALEGGMSSGRPSVSFLTGSWNWQVQQRGDLMGGVHIIDLWVPTTECGICYKEISRRPMPKPNSIYGKAHCHKGK